MPLQIYRYFLFVSITIQARYSHALSPTEGYGEFFLLTITKEGRPPFKKHMMMKNLHVKNFVFLLLISLNSFSQDGKFTFTIPSSVNTSAGVFKSDGTLLRTLWNNVRYSSGTYTKTWDGKDELGLPIASPEANYQIKIVTNNVNYNWQGTIGNSSDNMTGPSKHRGYYHCMKGLAFGPTYGYFCTGYSEASPSLGKFLISTPNQKINFPSSGTGTTANNDYVATDGVNVYWGGFDGYFPNNTFVYGTRVSDDLETDFSAGTAYTVTYGKTYIKTISKSNQGNSLISGLAVQKNGAYLFVARSELNQLQVLNKTTGDLVQILAFNSPRGLSVDGNDDLWIASGTNTVAKYAVNSNGSLTGAILTLSGLIDPLATQVSSDGSLISVADGSTSQQVKFFNNYNGASTNTLGTASGYASDANVNDNKFYFTDVNGSGTVQYRKIAFIAFQADGSFWVNDPGNFRVQHYNSGRNYIERIMSMGAKYSVFVDKNDIKKVFADFLEFEINYSVQSLTGSDGWTLKKNWGATTPAYPYDGSPRFETTLSNGRTYGFIRKIHDWEVVEFPANGQIRFTGIILSGVTKILCNDGSLQDYILSGTTAIVKRYPLTGFDGSGNPIWSTTAEMLATATIDNVVGSPVNTPNSQIFGSTDKIVFFNPKAYANDNGPVFSTGYHLGVMKKGATNSFLFQTEQSTHRDYEGPYPNAGYFDVGNKVSDFAGGNVNIIDRNIITSYHGEFWKDGQTNKYNHYYDNGLAIAQFGTTRPEVGFDSRAAAMMAGNSLTPVLVKDGNGDLYLFHGDESDHAGIHRWKITGLNTIAEKVITISYPSPNSGSTANYVNLMEGLPFDAVLTNNTAGWTRYPAENNESNYYSALWRVSTSKNSYKTLTSNDITVEFMSPSAATNTVSRDLGTNNISNSWKISGEVVYPPDNNVNWIVAKQYLEVLDANDKVLTTFYVGGSGNTTTIYGNDAAIASATDYSIQKNIETLLPFEMSVVNGMVTFKYGNYAPVTTTISDASGNWKTPRTLRIKFINNGADGPAYKQTIGIKDFIFYKDYSESTPAPTNQPPVANAGTGVVLKLPINSATLTGSGTDADGTIQSYSWIKISGPQQGSISNPNAANTQINNLTQGVYQFELTVTDNNGAVGKDIVQVNVSQVINAQSTNNLLPAVNPSNTINGLDYKYYEGSWSVLPAFSSLNPVKTGTTANFDLSQANRNTQYGFSFTGFINVPSDGEYTFYTSSDDGSDLYIDNVLVVANDGLHGTTEKSGAIGLQAGKHAITGLFFQQGGGEVFQVNYEGMGISKQAIPASALYRVTVNASQPASNLLPAVNPANTVNGLDYKYYEGSWNFLPAFSSLNPVKTGTTANFDLSQAKRNTQYGFSFTGFINVPSDGEYTFYTSSDDGSDLYIDNVLVVANDGLHGTTEKSGAIGLQAGKHAITGLFFQQGGGEVFQVNYEGMGISKQAIPESALYRVAVNAAQPASNLLPAVNPANTVNGLDYKYYEGSWNVLPQFSSLNPVKTGTTNNFNLTQANRSTKYGFSFSGFINVPSDSEYTFYTSSDDGSNLYIDNVLVVANDGLHATTEKSGTIGLQAGKHAITGLFFQQGGGQVFLVSYEGMEVSKQAVPASQLYRITTEIATRLANTTANQSVALPSNTTVSAINEQAQSKVAANISGSKFSQSNGLKIYPNPATDVANLSITTTGANNKLSISVYNSLGMLVSLKQLTVTQVNTLYKLDMTGLSKGIYSVIVTFEDGSKISYEIIKG